MRKLKYVYSFTLHVDILFPLTKVIPIMIERVTRYYQTLKTLIDYKVTRHHKFNVLPHALPYIFWKCNMVWGYFQRVTTHYLLKELRSLQTLFRAPVSGCCHMVDTKQLKCSKILLIALF